MSTLWLVFAVFMAGYLINIFYITVLYHRGLTHRAIELSPGLEKCLAYTGNWLTGIDPKAWACMHRLHHIHSDTDLDPHSPVHYGVFGVMLGQLRSYEKILGQLIRGNPEYTEIVSDIKFDVNILNRKKIWIIPYLVHIALAYGIGHYFGSVWVGIAYFLGIMSHPIQGWMVNSIAHHSGYRNFNSADNSKNNVVVAVLAFGEGFQNNHHSRPASANFAYKAGEIDLGYGLCLVAEKFGVLKIPRGVGVQETELNATY
ncbi:MAG: acyl-CoA desaturase [Chitinophagaceae bacterium]|nr:acyl-CoA desaturase [Oligoflexus sp.]